MSSLPAAAADPAAWSAPPSPTSPSPPTDAPTFSDGVAVDPTEIDPEMTIAPDPEDLEIDSGYGEGSDSASTRSATEDVFEFRRLHGRTFPNSQTAQYWMPNDEQQNIGLDLFHQMLLMMMDDKLYLAPIGDQVNHALDLGTGTGVWAIQFADQHPSAAVEATDLSPIQPEWVPANLMFVIDDCELDWTFDPNYFDYIHIRAMYGSISDWEALYRNAFTHLKPGGWFEHLDLDVRIQSDHVDLPKDHIFNQLADLFYEAGDRCGRTFRISHGTTMRDLLVKAGFVDIHEVKMKLPLHTWPKDKRLQDAGWIGQAALEHSVDGFCLYTMTEIMGWSRQQAIVMTAKMRKEMRKVSNCPWVGCTIVYGRKPADAPP